MLILIIIIKNKNYFLTHGPLDCGMSDVMFMKLLTGNLFFSPRWHVLELVIMIDLSQEKSILTSFS